MWKHIYYFDIQIGSELRAPAAPSCTLLLLFLALVIVHQTERFFVYVRMQSGVIVRRETVVNETIDKLSFTHERGPEHSDTVSSHLLRRLTLA